MSESLLVAVGGNALILPGEEGTLDAQRKNVNECLSDLLEPMKEGDILSGPVKYQTSTGWTIVVFSDGDVWDYVRKMIPPTGEIFEVWPEKEKEDCEGFRRLRTYHPPADQSKRTWGFMC